MYIVQCTNLPQPKQGKSTSTFAVQCTQHIVHCIRNDYRFYSHSNFFMNQQTPLNCEHRTQMLNLLPVSICQMVCLWCVQGVWRPFWITCLNYMFNAWLFIECSYSIEQDNSLIKEARAVLRVHCHIDDFIYRNNKII